MPKPHSSGPTVVPWRDEYAGDFERLNREWIEKHFSLETPDLDLFRNPRAAIVDAGGEIFFLVEGGQVLGTCAMIPQGPGELELGKMAVAPAARGRGFGDLLIEAAVAFARIAGARRVVLLTNSLLVPAIRLYEKHGFCHVPLEQSGYSRADVKMELKLG